MKNFLLCFLIILLMPGCHGIFGNSSELSDPNLVSVSYKITDDLIQNLSIKLDKQQPVLIASFVDIKYMEQSSDFGRVIAECITSRMAQKEYTIIEIKLRDSIYIKENAGEFLLSRKVKDISKSHNARAVIVGTYGKANKDVYISARIVLADTGMIVSSSDYRLPLTENMSAMFSSPFESVPVSDEKRKMLELFED